jgi:thiol:disulfide interchange protein DsbD
MVPFVVSFVVSLVGGWVRHKLSAWRGMGMGIRMRMGSSLTLGLTGVTALGWLMAGASTASLAQTDPLPSGKTATTLTLPPVSASGKVSAPGLSALLGQSAHVVVTDQVRAELVVHAPKGIQAGETFWLGLHLEHQPHWHTYWQNPGDSGLPTRLQWQLPNGLQAGDIAWPLPKKIPIGSLANYGYEGALLLAVPVTASADFKGGAQTPLSIQLKAEWLVCRQECIPQEGQFTLNLRASTPWVQQAALFEASRQRLAQPLPPVAANTPSVTAGRATLSEDGRQLILRIPGLPSSLRGKTLTVFPITAQVVHNAAVQGKDWTQSWQGDLWVAKIPVSEERGDSPKTMRWLMATGQASSPQAPAYEIEVPVMGTWPALAPAVQAEISPALAKALAENALANANPASTANSHTNTTAMGLTLAILGALVGGLLLNLMPCVFPVLAIKVLGFATTQNDAAHTAARHRAAGMAYTAGVVISFLLLGGLMLALRAAGEQLGWGFQLQSPLVVAGLALLFTLLGLNLAGLFEFGNFLPSRLATLQSRHPTVDAALSGVLAVAVASPCTAPFMGASLGLAIALPVWQALAVFAAMGLGMALPYLAASNWPGIARALPRPGAWMVVFRQAMAFPMLATVIWLLWVLGQQTGIDGATGLLAILLAVSGWVWAWGLTGRARWILGGLFVCLFLWLSSHWLPEVLRVNAGPAAISATSTTVTPTDTPTPGGKPSPLWQNWSPAAQQAHLDAGRPVFVDFTAAWCVTCQYNKKTTLADAQLLADFAARHVVLMRADWTRRDPAITQALSALGRSGVPVYALYAPQQRPVLLSELPSVAEVQTALQQLPKAP